MEYINLKTIFSDDEYALLTIMLISLPEELYNDQDNAWVIFDPKETDPEKCIIEVFYEDIVYRHVNPFTEDMVSCSFEDIESYGYGVSKAKNKVYSTSTKDLDEIYLLTKFFPKVEIKFILRQDNENLQKQHNC